MRVIVLIISVLIGVSSTVLADILLKKSGGQNIPLFLAGVLLYALVAVPVVIAFRISEFGLLFIIWEAATVALGLIISVAVFRETMTLQKSLAFLLTIAALLLANWR